MRAAVAVMAKVPRPGAVKTRLARTLGPETACALYQAFVGDLDERLRHLGYPVLWFYWPADPVFRAFISTGAAAYAQRGGDLGERMQAAFADAFALGFAPVLMLGADVPDVPLRWLAEAVDRLTSGDQVVLGPAADGGYYVIGLQRPTPEVFRDVCWGTPEVCEATRQRIRGAGLRASELPRWSDIDDQHDVDRLAASLADDHTCSLRRTRAVLAAAGLLSPAS